MTASADGGCAIAIVGGILLAEALLRSLGFDQRAVDNKVFAVPKPLRQLVDFGEEALWHLQRQQAVTLFRKYRRRYYRIIHAEPDEQRHVDCN